MVDDVLYHIFGGDLIRSDYRLYETLEHKIEKEYRKEPKKVHILITGGDGPLAMDYVKLSEELGFKAQFDENTRNTDDDIRSLIKYIKENPHIKEVYIITDWIHMPRLKYLMKYVPAGYYLKDMSDKHKDVEDILYYNSGKSIEEILKEKGIKVNYISIEYNPGLRKLTSDIVHEVLGWGKRFYELGKYEVKLWYKSIKEKIKGKENTKYYINS